MNGTRACAQPGKLVAVALANTMARIAWMLMTKKETYRNLETVAARAAAAYRDDVGGVSRTGDR